MFIVKVRKNDLKQTFISRVGTTMEAPAALMLTRDLNALFATQGLNWFAEAVEEAD